MQIVSPFPLEQLPAAWQWLQEYPSANFDDYGPSTSEAFQREMTERLKTERSWGILKDGQYCGIVGFCQLTPRMGTLHGVCFAQGRCWNYEKRQALRQIFNELFGSGIEKICAGFFADNYKIQCFLADLGAVKEAYFKRHTFRDGLAIDMVQVAIFNPRA